MGHNHECLPNQEAIGPGGPRWYRSFISNRIDGQWSPWAATDSNSFVRSNNVIFPAGTTAGTRDFSHGELLRANNDQTLTIDPCRLQFAYQGVNPDASGDYSQLPYRMGLLTQTDSTCRTGSGPIAPRFGERPDRALRIRGSTRGRNLFDGDTTGEHRRARVVLAFPEPGAALREARSVPSSGGRTRRREGRRCREGE